MTIRPARSADCILVAVPSCLHAIVRIRFPEEARSFSNSSTVVFGKCQAQVQDGDVLFAIGTVQGVAREPDDLVLGHMNASSENSLSAQSCPKVTRALWYGARSQPPTYTEMAGTTAVPNDLIFLLSACSLVFGYEALNRLFRMCVKVLPATDLLLYATRPSVHPTAGSYLYLWKNHKIRSPLVGCCDRTTYSDRRVARVGGRSYCVRALYLGIITPDAGRQAMKPNGKA
jgi:hypothetical protein